jgi:hypothetical protein
MINVFAGILVQMSNKCSGTSISGIFVGGTNITYQAGMANTLAFFFSSVCISDNYYAMYKYINKTTELEPLHFL